MMAFIASIPAPVWAGNIFKSDGVGAQSCYYNEVNEQVRVSRVSGHQVSGATTGHNRPADSLPERLNLNTEFSAVRVNGQPINLTRFSVFMPADQGSFSEDAGIIKFASLGGNGQPFSSGTVGLTADGKAKQQHYGGKLNGRFGGFNLETVGGPQITSASLNSRNLLVGRSTFNVSEDSSLGIIYTDGDPRHDRTARTMGADFRFLNNRLLEDRIISGDVWFQITDNEQLETGLPETGASDSGAWGVRLEYPDERHRLEGSYYHFGKDFDPAMGFVNRPGVDDLRIFYQFHQQAGSVAFLRLDQQVTVRSIESTFDDEKSQKLHFKFLSAETSFNDRIEAFVLREREVLIKDFDLLGKLLVAPGDYAYTRYGVDFNSANNRSWGLGIRAESGEFLDGERKSWHIRTEWKPLPGLNLRAEYNVNQLSQHGGDFTARVMSLRSELAIGNRWYLAPQVQFDNVSEALGINAQLRWHPAQGQDLFFIWSHKLLRDTMDRFHSVPEDNVIKGVFTLRM